MSSFDPLRREPWIHTWEEDGIQRQIAIHYAEDGRSVQFAPRYRGDPEPWFDGDHEFDSSFGRVRDEEVVTLGPCDRPGWGLIDPDPGPDDEDYPPTPSVGPADAGPTPRSEEEQQPMAITKIPDVVNHRALLNALNAIRAEVEGRQEDVNNLATWSKEMTARLEGMAEELGALNVDSTTIGNVHAVRDAVAGQSGAAARYANATDNSVTQAATAARTAHRNHGRIEEAVNDAPVPMAKAPFYDTE